MKYESLLLIVGREADDQAEPFIVGAFNNEYMNQIPLEEGEKMINALKETWTGDRFAYEWREAVVIVPMDDLSEMFKVPVIEGKVVKS